MHVNLVFFVPVLLCLFGTGSGLPVNYRRCSLQQIDNGAQSSSPGTAMRRCYSDLTPAICATAGLDIGEVEGRGVEFIPSGVGYLVILSYRRKDRPTCVHWVRVNTK